MSQDILQKFQLTEKDLLGSGGESLVYKLDDHRVLRILRSPKDKRWHLKKLRDFYNALPKMSFATPVIRSVNIHEGITFSIEDMMPGKPFAQILPRLSREEKEKALSNYLAAVEELKQVQYPHLPYGDLLSKELTTSETWSGFLTMRINSAIEKNSFDADVPNLGKVAELTREMVGKLPDPAKALVHGDYFPDNVMMDEELNITGVVDFSPMTIVGDPLMDVAGGLIFLETFPDYVPENSEILRKIITSKYGDVDNVILTYRLYYSFYFSNVKKYAPALYQWCMNNLNKVAN